MGRYQGTSGAAWAAAGRVRQPRGAPCGIPGGGKGLMGVKIPFPFATTQYGTSHIESHTI